MKNLQEQGEGGCANGNVIANNILNSNSGRVFLIGCHPGKSGFTMPYSTDPDLGKQFLDMFFSNSFAGAGNSGFTFMPGGIINRRIWNNSARNQSTSLWSSHTNTILNENSPVNVGLSANYNNATQGSLITIG